MASNLLICRSGRWEQTIFLVLGLENPVGGLGAVKGVIETDGIPFATPKQDCHWLQGPLAGCLRETSAPVLRVARLEVSRSCTSLLAPHTTRESR